jgi:hypothetical protein
MPGDSEINVTNLRRLGSPPIACSPSRRAEVGPGGKRARRAAAADRPPGTGNLLSAPNERRRLEAF